MSSMTELLDAAAKGDRVATAAILPLVYADLRATAAALMAGEAAGHSLDATALVHEAYLRLVGPAGRWESRRHFFGAAAESMRQILVDAARRKKAEKRGGKQARADIDLDRLAAAEADPDRWLMLDEALTAFAAEDPDGAELAKLRLCVGLPIEEAGEVMGMSRATAFRQWNFARAWLTAALADHSPDDDMSPTA